MKRRISPDQARHYANLLLAHEHIMEAARMMCRAGRNIVRKRLLAEARDLKREIDTIERDWK